MPNKYRKHDAAADQKALDLYNAKWSGEEAPTTRALYEAAAPSDFSPLWGEIVQDHVLSLLGHSSAPRLRRVDVTPEVQAFADHMTRQE